MTGTLEILNCGHGDMKVTFDDKNPLELERAKRIIQDMLKRGYALFVHGKDDVLVRVKRFDAKKNEYIIADGPVYAGDEPFQNEQVESPELKKRKERPVPMSKAKVTAVGRSAGG